MYSVKPPGDVIVVVVTHSISFGRSNRWSRMDGEYFTDFWLLNLSIRALKFILEHLCRDQFSILTVSVYIRLLLELCFLNRTRDAPQCSARSY